MPEEATSVAGIAANLVRVRERMARAAQRAGRSPDEITLIAVSKTFPAEAIRAAFEAGQRHFGENRVQEFEAKHPALSGLRAPGGNPPVCHLIGHLQSNKARRAAGLFDSVDSLDSVPLARKLASGAAQEAPGKRLRILLEVHLGGEESKSGADESELPALAEATLSLPELELGGLMAVPPFFDDPERVRPYFAKLRGLRDDLSRRLAHPLRVLSMGMSHDFEIAIEEGATEVRVGTAIFGERRRPA